MNLFSKPNRSSWFFRYRFVVAFAGAVCLALAVVLMVTWYEQDRPLREVETALKRGQNSDALKLISKYLQDKPQDARGLSLKARVLVEIGQNTEAIRLFRRVGAADASDLHAWAKAHLMRQEWSDAQPILQRILDLNSNDADALHELTACLSYLGRPTQAIEMAHRMAKIKGQEARALLQLGTLHENLGNKKSAVEAWGKLLEYAPTAEGLQVPAAEFLTAYGTVLLDEGHVPEAVKTLKSAVQQHESAEAHLRLGQALQQSDELDQAISEWKRALELAPESRESREALAEVAYSHRNLDEAREWLAPLLAKPKLASSTAYLMQRICLASVDREAGEQWRLRTAELHQQEHILSVVNHVVAESPDSYWSRVVRAYRFAEQKNWHEAESMMLTLGTEPSNEPFINQLAIAIRRHGSLPSLDLIPIHHFR